MATEEQYRALIADLNDEFEDFRSMLADRDAAVWDLATPAEGWAVRDQVSHLAYFDEVAALAITDEASFVTKRDELISSGADPMTEHLERGRAMDGAELMGWLDGAHEGLVAAASGLSPDARIAWFGPPMGAMSFVSARLMEFWAHGQDVADALGVRRVPTARLHHIAGIGVRARKFSYMVRGMEVPPGRIEISLTPPAADGPEQAEGGRWTWVVQELLEPPAVGDSTRGVVEDGPGNDGAFGSISGPAEDFCLVVVQRRNVADTALVVTGDLAVEWMRIAQAFAGPPGEGRAPGT